ncbi:MAG: hypothetical protein ACRET6_00350, partial [Burkholderiales bacterium]
TLGSMETLRTLLPNDWRSRIGWATGSALAAGLFFGFLGTGALAWNTIGYWIFVAAVFCLSFAICKLID